MASSHLFFTFLLITHDLNEIEKNPEQPFLELLSGKCVQNFSKKY